jgi:hypothetical protein
VPVSFLSVALACATTSTASAERASLFDERPTPAQGTWGRPKPFPLAGRSNLDIARRKSGAAAGKNLALF